jgi:two-component system nitrate/nitrite response regulator NarL
VTTIPIAMVDDDTILHYGLETWLAMAGPGLELVATAESVAELLSGPGRTARVVLLDLRLHDHVPIADNVRAIRAAGPAVVACSSADDLDMIREAIAAGAHSYVPKRKDPAEARAAIEAADAGLVYTSRAHAAAMAVDRHPGRPELSPQEREALRLYASGLTMASVARRLRIRPGTAKSYVDRVREKYDEAGRPARSKMELRDRAVEDGILSHRTAER